MSARVQSGLRFGLSKHSSVVRQVPWPSTWMAPPSSTNGVRYRSVPSISNTFCATSSSRSQGKYKPPSRPPQALKVQSTPLRRPFPSMTNVAPQSRIHASLLLISTTRTSRGKRARAFWNCAAETPTLTGSAPAMAVAIAANTACAGLAPQRQLSGRSGQSIQQPECRSNSAGMRKPSFVGVEVSVRNAWSPAAHASIAAQFIGAKRMSDAKPVNVQVPAGGEKITISNGKLHVPDQPIIPFIEGDGTGRDIWRASVRVFDAAAQKAYGGKRKIHWMEVLAGEKANKAYNTWLPDETVTACRDYLISIKGPLTTPVGGGIRSLNVALRQLLDLYVCLRPVRWFKGVPSPVKTPEKVDMVIFRENTEDIYAGIEFEQGSAECEKFLDLFKQNFPKQFAKIRFPDTSGIGLKPASKEGTERLFRAAVKYAIDNKRKSVTIVHKGNIMKFTEGAFRGWSYQLAEREFPSQVFTWEQWERIKVAKDEKEANAQMDAARKAGKVIIKDAIADIPLQQVLPRPEEFEGAATMNLNGDYLSDALAAQVGGIGIAPGGNINYMTGHAVFEATHGTAPKYANQDKVNPGSVILSGEMMFRYMGWAEAADLILKGLKGAIASKRVTYDFARLMDGATEIKCSQFGANVIEQM